MKRSATEKIRRVESRFSKAERFNVAKETGLSTAQVELRNKQGLSNKVHEAITKQGGKSLSKISFRFLISFYMV